MKFTLSTKFDGVSIFMIPSTLYESTLHPTNAMIGLMLPQDLKGISRFTTLA